MKLESFYPVICVENVAETADFYRNHLKFKTVFESSWYVHLQMEGNGRAVTLSEIGYLGDVISASERMIFTSLENQVADKMKTIKSGPLSYRTRNSYDFSGVHWVLGRGVVETLTVGDVTKNGNILTFKGEISYTYSDEITDPISIRQAIRGHHRIKDLPASWQGGTELFVTDLFFGRAYAVNGAWKTRISGSVTLKE